MNESAITGNWVSDPETFLLAFFFFFFPFWRSARVRGCSSLCVRAPVLLANVEAHHAGAREENGPPGCTRGRLLVSRHQ